MYLFLFKNCKTDPLESLIHSEKRLVVGLQMMTCEIIIFSNFINISYFICRNSGNRNTPDYKAI